MTFPWCSSSSALPSNIKWRVFLCLTFIVDLFQENVEKKLSCNFKIFSNQLQKGQHQSLKGQLLHHEDQLQHKHLEDHRKIFHLVSLQDLNKEGFHHKDYQKDSILNKVFLQDSILKPNLTQDNFNKDYQKDSILNKDYQSMVFHRLPLIQNKQLILLLLLLYSKVT